MRATARPCGRLTSGHSNSSGPIVVNGKVIEGLGGCGNYQEEKCFLSAYDAATGNKLWRFYTVATTGKTGGNTWGNLPDKIAPAAKCGSPAATIPCSI